ncbi:MAG: YaaL family protein [Roseburia sp.]|nr:YaaL family protein [Roseburia sp.]
MKTYFSLKRFLKPTQDTDNTPETPLLTPREKLLDDIEKTQHALEVAYCGFDYVTDPDLIDCYIYEVNSALKRYRFLLQQAERMQGLEEPGRSSESLLAEHELVSQLCPIPGSLSLHHN